MINPFSQASNGVQIINPNIAVQYLASTGYTIGAGRVQTPTYADPIGFTAQLQRMTQKEIDKSGVVAIAGEFWKIFVPMHVSTIIRPTSKGGDLFVINGENWYIYQVLGSWAQFTVAMISLQDRAQS